MATTQILDNLYNVGVQDPDLRVFDVVMETEYGTSYNCFLLKTKNYNVLFETVKEKYFDKFIKNVSELCDPSEIDYIVINHTEPDHAGSLEKLINYAPKAKVLASSIALNFLKDICNIDLPSTAVSDKQVIELEDDIRLRFISVPFLHWPDSMYTYIEGKNTLVTCDSFGCHYSDERVCNDLIKGDFINAYKYYFDMIMGPFKSHVQYALKRIEEYDIKTICPGHGPVLRTSLDYNIDLYDKWSQEPEPEERAKPKVVIPFVSAYGYTEQLANTLSQSIQKIVDAEVKLYDMVYADPETVQNEMNSADGILLGSPTINGDVLPPIMNLIMGMNGILHGGKVAGAFGSFGWSGEAVDMLMARLKVLRMNTIEPALKVTFKPSSNNLIEAEKYGQKFGAQLKEKWENIGSSESGKTFWKCAVCGEIFEGAMPPLTCSVCGVGVEGFVEYIPEVINYSSDEELKVVIIGGGIAGVSAAEAIRKRNKKAQIDIYTNENFLPYHRPVITKKIAEEVSCDDFLIHSENYYTENKINIHLGQNITKVNPASNSIELDNSTNVAYDKLVLATGASCFIPPIPGADLPEVIALRTQKDLNNLKDLTSSEPKKIVVIGGGLLGLETGCSLSQLNHEVTILEACPSILPRQLDPEGASILEKEIRKSCKNLQLGVFVEAIEGEDHVKGVRTKSEDVIPCDIVIISAGVRSDTNLAKNAGLTVDRAIVVNQYMQTSDQNIYAVGDCAICNERFDGIWETALDQGNIAGANITGDKITYEPKVFGASLHAFNTALFSIGNIGSEDATYETVSQKNEINGQYSKFYFKDGTIVGGILLGDVLKTNILLTAINKNFNVEAAQGTLFPLVS